jgi:phage-related protein
MADWQIEFFENDRYAQGDERRIPFLTWLEGLRDPKLEQRFAAAFRRLKAENVAAREPLVKKLDEKLWEVRVDFDRRAYRAVYVTVHERRFVILHGFVKKQQKTPRRELEAAQRLLVQLLYQEKRRKRER